MLRSSDVCKTKKRFLLSVLNKNRIFQQYFVIEVIVSINIIVRRLVIENSFARLFNVATYSAVYIL